jgi:D-sedoheptulose 7-phosphate isomerase
VYQKGVDKSMKHLELTARSNEFDSVIANTICTSNTGKEQDIEKSIQNLIAQLLNGREQGNAVYLVGNGGSAGIASHALTDFLNVCKLRAFTLHDSSLMTCMANDFGYEVAFARILDTVLRPNDILIAISSSGKSANICNAAKMATDKGGIVVTLSGFQAENPLRKLGDFNFWLNSCDYGMVEIGHQFILHNVADRIGQDAKRMQAAQQQVTIA